MKLRTTITCKECVRMGEKLCSKPSGKCSVERNRLRKNSYVPSRRLSDYGNQLKEKQKARIIYGVMEKQFRGYVSKASKMDGIAGENLLSLLESRLDNVVYRLGFAPTRPSSRQMVSHKHFLVNGVIVNIPSYVLKAGDKISVRDKSKKIDIILDSIRTIKGDIGLPWLDLDKAKMTGTFLNVPERDQMNLTVNEQLVVELYSK